MRDITSNAATQVTRQFGAEPIIVIALKIGGTFLYYGDRDHENFQGRLIDVEGLDSVINIGQNTSRAAITFQLIDTDKELKALYDTYDLHKCPCRIYQYFPETDFHTDKILLFDGQLASPIIYDEAQMTLSLTGLSKIEDVEVGFSPDNSLWEHIIPNEIESQAWPMPFGTPIDYPLTQISRHPQGTLVDGFGCVDFTLRDLIYQIGRVIANLRRQRTLLIFGRLMASYSINRFKDDLADVTEDIERISEKLADVNLTPSERERYQDDLRSAQEAQGRIQQRLAAVEQLLSQLTAERDRLLEEEGNMEHEQMNHIYKRQQQQTYHPTTLSIFNGGRFPAEEFLWLKIGQALVLGAFTHTDEAQNVSTLIVAKVVHPRTCEFTGAFCFELSKPARVSPGPRLVPQKTTANPLIDFSAYSKAAMTRQSVGHLGAETQIEGTTAGFAWIPSGSSVRRAITDPAEYVISIVPCQVSRLVAYRDHEGTRLLETIPPEYYTTTERDYGDGLVATILKLTRPLDTLANKGYDSVVYATVESSVGPNVVDVIEYLVGRYLPNTTCDVDSFNQTREAVEDWPVNFVLLDRYNIIDLLSDICRQACLAIWFVNNTVYLRYLPNVPDYTKQITLDDINAQSLQLHYTPTEDLVTKIVATYRLTYAEPDPYRLAARYNIAKYGVTEDRINYFIYNDREAVLHSVTFWLIRLANTWKYVEFTTALNSLTFETMDAVTLDPLDNLAAYTPVTGVIEEVMYDSHTFELKYRVWLPVRAGEMSTYKFAYYNIGHITDEFPEPYDWVTGNGVAPPVIRDLEARKPALKVNFNRITDPERPQPKSFPVRRYPKSPRTPTKSYTTPVYPAVDPGYRDGGYLADDGEEIDMGPELADLSEDPVPDYEGLPDQEVLSLQRTLIYDDRTGEIAYLESVFARIADEKVHLQPKLAVSEGEGENGIFELKWVEGTDDYAAKLAFLADD